MNRVCGSALITAGGGGAGLVIARAFANAGMRVAVCDIDSGAVRKAREEGLLAIDADCSLEPEVERIFRIVESKLGAVEVLVNNVGIAGPTAPIDSVTLADWERTFRVNLTSHFLCIRRAVPAMKAAGKGLIVNISSGSAKVGLPLRAPYVTTKGAVISLSMTLARELGPSGIRVNAILPGAIRGERIKCVVRDKAASLGIEPSEYERSLLRYISLRTMVEPEDIAAMVVFLASDAGSRITGQAIGVDGNVEWEE